MKENVLFILVDCLRADKCYGDKRTAQTPNIDSLVKKGTFFTKMIATTTTTTPSVASLFTGVYTFAHGMRSLKGYKLSDSVSTLAEVFKENGYNTYAEVTGPLSPITGLNRGFDSYNQRGLSKGSFIGEWGDSLITKFKNNEFKEPWFIFIHLWELHDPRSIAKGFNNDKFGKNKYERALSSLDARLGELFSHVDFDSTVLFIHGDHGEKIIETMFVEYLYELKEHLKKIVNIPRKLFAGTIRKTFKLFRLEYEKLPAFAKHNYKPKNNKPVPVRLFGHGFHIYDSAVVIPLIISGNKTGLAKSKFISTQARQIDIFPTILDMLNLSFNKRLNLHGRSLMPLLRGQDLDELPAYCEASGTVLGDKIYWKVGLRTPQYKFIYRPYNNQRHEELYDLQKDSLEKRNIIKNQPQIAKSMLEQLDSIRKVDLNEIKLVGQKMTEQEEKILTERLRNLGYLE